MAITAVFGTPELLETIPFELPIKDLLVNAQRVNTTFNATIQASAKLQRALFFEPLPGPSLHYMQFNRTQLHDLPSENVHHTVIDNPFYSRLMEDDPYLSLKCSEQSLRALQRPEASWRRMLVSQPPIVTSSPDVSILEPIDSPFVSSWRKIGRINLSYRGVRVPESQHARDVICGLTIGVVEDHFPPEGRIGGVYTRRSSLPNVGKREDVTYAWEVRRITGPRPGSFLKQVTEVESGEISTVRLWRPFDRN